METADLSAAAVGRFRVPAIVAVATAVLFAANGFILGGLTVFDSRMLVELHLSNAALRMRDTITVLTLGLSVPIVGHVIDRYPVRPILIGGLAVMSAAFFLYARIENVWQIYALHILLGVSQATSGVVTCVYLISGWTGPRRGMALGILIGGSSLGNALVPPLNAALLSHFANWRTAILSGAFVGLALIPLVFLVVREPAGRMVHASKDGRHKTGPTLLNILRSRAYVLLAAIAATTVFCVLALATTLALYAASSSAAMASGPLLLFAVFMSAVVAQIGAGFATSRIPLERIHGVALALMLAGAVGFAAAPFWLSIAAATVFGLGWGGNSSMLQIRPAILFEGSSLGSALALLAVVETMGGGLGPVAAGYIRDVSGGYGAVFLIVAILMVLPIIAAASFPRVRP